MGMTHNMNHSQLVFLTEDTQLVNEHRDIYFFCVSIPILIATVTVNVWAGLTIGSKEGTGINSIIVCDCVVNALSMTFDTLYVNSPWSILRSLPPCVILVFVHNLMVTWNRLVPVAIVVFRYMMVCHAVFSHNLGGEKVVWRGVRLGLLVLCLLNPLVVVLNSSDSIVFLVCMGREEAFK